MTSFWKRLRGCFGIFLIFALGVVFGAAITGAGIYRKIRDLAVGGPETVVTYVVDELHKELELDDVQKRKLQSIADDTRLRLRVLQDRSRPEVDTALQSATAEVRSMLSEKQRRKYDEMLKSWREQWENTALEEAKQETPKPTPATTPEPVLEQEAKPAPAPER